MSSRGSHAREGNSFSREVHGVPRAHGQGRGCGMVWKTQSSIGNVERESHMHPHALSPSSGEPSLTPSHELLGQDVLRPTTDQTSLTFWPGNQRVCESPSVSFQTHPTKTSHLWLHFSRPPLKRASHGVDPLTPGRSVLGRERGLGAPE